MIKVRKKYNVILIIISTIIAIFFIGYKFISIIADNKHTGIDIPKNSTMLKEEDTHGGFHGDGEYYSEVQLIEDGVKEFVNVAMKTGEWLQLPLSKDIEIILYGGEYEGIGYHIGNKSKNIPRDIKSGIYYFKDRFAERNPNEKNRNIISRGSYNLTLAVLDLGTNILYIYELDT